MIIRPYNILFKKKALRLKCFFFQGEATLWSQLRLAVGGLMFLPALASQSFRSAGQDIALTLVRWVSEMWVVYCRGGWPSGMEGLGLRWF